MKKNERLAFFLKKIGKTQTDLARELNITKSAINMCVKGQQKIPTSLIFYLQRTYHLNNSWLENEEGEIFENYDQNEKRIINIYQELDEVEKAKLTIFTDSLIKEHKQEKERKKQEETLRNNSNRFLYVGVPFHGEFLVDKPIGLKDIAESCIPIPSLLVPPIFLEQFFCLRISSETIKKANLHLEEIVIFRKGSQINYQGQLGVVIINNEYYIKKIFIREQKIVLSSMNEKNGQLIFPINNDSIVYALLSSTCPNEN